MKKLLGTEAQVEISHPGVHLLVFQTEWCPDCKMMQLVVKDLVHELRHNGQESFDVIEVDAEEANLFRTSGNGQVLKVPSFYLIKNEQIEHLGYEYVPAEKIKNALLKALER